jgi:ketosteroid isomerase-like protein
MNTSAADRETAARIVERLRDATNDHNPDGVAACFTHDYRSETPAHPARSFNGRDQVRKNQEKIFDFVPDLTVELLRMAVDGDTIWTEWEHRGIRRDGSPHHMRGAIILGMRDGLACWGRFYLEPVEETSGDINVAIHRDVATPRTDHKGGSVA